ncbi:MAG: prephenate dehydrogenase/arogenate dehydrogenase family protein [Pseudomonadota bacterium]
MTSSDADIDFDALKKLRNQLDEVDQRLVQTISDRLALVSKIGALKAAEGHQTRDFRREKVVLDKAADAANAAGIPTTVATDILKVAIRASLENQERARIRGAASGDGKRALVVGGAGRMGRWFAEFLHSQGFAVTIADPAADQKQPHVAESLEAAGVDFDVIVIASTLAVSAQLLRDLAVLKPRGLVFDVGSLKSPLNEPLRELAATGARVTSVHPMFGPSTRLLAGRHIIFCDAGDAQALQDAKSLFADTMADCVEMSLEDHDRLIAYVLGLSHFVNIVFIDALASSGLDADALSRISSTTFDAQLAMGASVVNENPGLYFEIQRLNQFGELPLDALTDAVDYLRDAIRSDDAGAFTGLMVQAREYVDGIQDSKSGTR